MSGKISRNWKLSGRLLGYAVPARLIELRRKERPGFYAGFCQTFLNFICWTVRQHHRKAEWSRFEFGRKQRQQYVRITAEQAAQELHAFTPRREQPGHSLQLFDAQSRQQIRHLPVESEKNVMEWPVLAMAPQQPRLGRGLFVSRPEHSALAGGDQLVPVEGEG